MQYFLYFLPLLQWQRSFVIAHPTSTGGWTDNLAANTNWRTARTEAWLTFAVLTTERKAA